MTSEAIPFVGAIATPHGYVPLTERLVGWLGSRRWTVAIFASLPFVHLLGFWLLAQANGLDVGGPETVVAAIPVRLMNLYLVLLTFWGAARVARQLSTVEAALDHPDHPAATWRTWLGPPLALALVFAVLNEVQHAIELGAETVAARPLPFVVSGVLAVLIRIPTMTAFWTAVVALIATARLGHEGRLGTFPEDRSLGLRPIGEMVFQVFLLLAAAFLPIFAVSARPVDFVASAALLVGGELAILVATWELHRRMVEVRTEALATARRAYAKAYRAAMDAPADQALGSTLGAAEALVRGAESIHEWPFDERTQRLVALVATGVLTGLIVRMILYAFGV